MGRILRFEAKFISSRCSIYCKKVLVAGIDNNSYADFALKINRMRQLETVRFKAIRLYVYVYTAFAY